MNRTYYETLDRTIDEMVRRGFTEHFAVAGVRLRALDSGRTFRPEELVIRDYRRFEGISDPDDMSIVYAIESRSGMRGTLVDAFGVYANPVIGVFLQDVVFQNAASHAAPGET